LGHGGWHAMKQKKSRITIFAARKRQNIPNMKGANEKERTKRGKIEKFIPDFQSIMCTNACLIRTLGLVYI